MSDLYTQIMEKVMPILTQYWQFALIGFGLIFLLGAIFNWKWTWNPEGNRPFGVQAFAYRNFGEKGARFTTGVAGILVIIGAIVLWVLM